MANLKIKLLKCYLLNKVFTTEGIETNSNNINEVINFSILSLYRINSFLGLFS